MIFGKLILGDFGILMSNIYQVQTILSFQRIAFEPGWPPKDPFWPKMPLLETLEVIGGRQLPPIGLPGLDSWSPHTWLIAQPDDLCYCSLAIGVDHLVGGGNLI